MYVCICRSVTDEQIRREVCDGAHTLDEISRRLGVATGCGRCRAFATVVVSEARNYGDTILNSPEPGLSMVSP